LDKNDFGKGELSSEHHRFPYHLTTILIAEFQVAENVSKKCTEEGGKQMPTWKNVGFTKALLISYDAYSCIS